MSFILFDWFVASQLWWHLEKLFFLILNRFLGRKKIFYIVKNFFFPIMRFIFICSGCFLVFFILSILLVFEMKKLSFFICLLLQDRVVYLVAYKKVLLNVLCEQIFEDFLFQIFFHSHKLLQYKCVTGVFEMNKTEI